MTRRSVTRRGVYGGLALALLASVLAQRSHAQVQETGWNWRSVQINGMGFVTGLLAHPSTGDIFARTDVGGIYRFDRANQRWLPLMDALPLQESPALDIESFALDPSSPQRIAVLVQRDSNRQSPGGGDYNFGDVLLTTDGGMTWQPQGLLPREIAVGGNKEYRGFSGERLAFDPRSPQRIIVASRVNGVLIKESLNSAWTLATGNPAVTPWSSGDPSDLEYKGNTPGHTFIAFDPISDALPDGSTSVAYLGDHATGVYRSLDGGRTWEIIPGGPQFAVHALVHNDGTLYVSCARFPVGPDANLPEIGSVHRYDPATNTWTDITPALPGNPNVRDYQAYAGLTKHPGITNELIVTAAGDSEIYRSTNRGESWTRVKYGSPANTPLYNELPRPENYEVESTDWGTVSPLIDPLNPRTVWQTNGFGVVRCDDFIAAPTQWTWVMENFEELVIHQLACPPVPFEQGGADLLSAAMDMVALRHDNVNVVPTIKAAHPLQIGQANGLAYSYQNPQHAAIVGWDTWRPWFTLSGYTSDNGRTWTPFPDVSPGQAGALAMSSTNPQNIIWEAAFWKPLRVSFDAGATWQFARDLDATFDATNTDPDYAENWWKLGYAWHVVNTWWTGQHIAADKVSGNRFYRYTWGQFKFSSDGGLTWRNGFNAWGLGENGPGVFSVRTKLVTHPTRAGEVWIAEVPNNDQPARTLHRSTDGGVTIQPIFSLQWATHVAFGKGVGAVPDIYIHGVPVGATAEGIYVSRDDAQTWTLVSSPSTNKFAKITSLEADMRLRNRVFVGTGGRGIFVGEGLGGVPVRCDSIDFNDDGLFPDDNDLVAFLTVLAGGSCATCNDIDFNNDGLFPDDNDLVAYLRVLAGGSCASL